MVKDVENFAGITYGLSMKSQTLTTVLDPIFVSACMMTSVAVSRLFLSLFLFHLNVCNNTQIMMNIIVLHQQFWWEKKKYIYIR